MPLHRNPLIHLTIWSVAWATTSGCITISPSSSSPLSLKSLLPNRQQASYEEPVAETPPDPENPARLKLAYARWMEEIGQSNEARRHYVDVAETEPENVQALLGLARLDLLAGNPSEAERRLQSAMRIAPENAAVQFGWGQYLASQERWRESIGPLKRALSGEPANDGYRQQLAIALVHAGDVEAALPHFMQTVGDAEAHYNVALILKDEGRLQDAERQLVLALTKKPEMEPARRWLAELRKGRGEAASADANVTHAAVQPSAPPPAGSPRFYRPIPGRQGHSTLAMKPSR